MTYNAMAFKKTMLAWDAVAKKAPAELGKEAKMLGGNHPDVAKLVATQAKQITVFNERLGDVLDDVVEAKDDKARVEAEKRSLGVIKQYQSFVNSTHLTPKIQTNLKNGLAALVKVLS